MEERLKRIEKFTKAMRELLAKMLEEDPDSSSNIYKEIWGSLYCWDELLARVATIPSLVN